MYGQPECPCRTKIKDEYDFPSSLLGGLVHPTSQFCKSLPCFIALMEYIIGQESRVKQMQPTQINLSSHSCLNYSYVTRDV